MDNYLNTAYGTVVTDHQNVDRHRLHFYSNQAWRCLRASYHSNQISSEPFPMLSYLQWFYTLHCCKAICFAFVNMKSINTGVLILNCDLKRWCLLVLVSTQKTHHRMSIIYRSHTEVSDPCLLDGCPRAYHVWHQARSRTLAICNSFFNLFGAKSVMTCQIKNVTE